MATQISNGIKYDANGRLVADPLLTVNETGGSPGGNSSDVQFNSSNAFEGSDSFQWDDTHSVLGIGTGPFSSQFSPAIDLTPSGTITAVTYICYDFNLASSLQPNGVFSFSSANFNNQDGIIQTYNDDPGAPTAGSLYLITGGGHSSNLTGVSLAGPADSAVPGVQIQQGNHQFTGDASSILQIDSTTQGFLPPRMNSTQRDAISSPVEGLEIYNLTTHTKDYYNGTTWKQIATV